VVSDLDGPRFGRGGRSESRGGITETAEASQAIRQDSYGDGITERDGASRGHPELATGDARHNRLSDIDGQTLSRLNRVDGVGEMLQAEVPRQGVAAAGW